MAGSGEMGALSLTSWDGHPYRCPAGSDAWGSRGGVIGRCWPAVGEGKRMSSQLVGADGGIRAKI